MKISLEKSDVDWLRESVSEYEKQLEKGAFKDV